MSYTKVTDFAAKDALLSGNPSKIVKGTEIGAEFDAIVIADASNVKGPTSPSSTDNAIVRWDTTSGRLVQNSLVTIDDSGTLTAPNIAPVSINGVGYTKNVIINGGFTVNQRAYVSGAVLASGSYGHDRWKAGASGGDYTFTQLASNTQITIATGKSLIQVIEDKNVQSTRYVVSWTGTAQARVGVNSATPSGAYAASPIVITGQTAGTVMSVEFNTGTLGTVQVEATTGSVASAFEYRPYAVEQSLCFRYAKPAPVIANGVYGLTGNTFNVSYNFESMRAAPAVTPPMSFTTSNCTASIIGSTIISITCQFSITATGAWTAASNNSPLLIAEL